MSIPEVSPDTVQVLKYSVTLAGVDSKIIIHNTLLIQSVRRNNIDKAFYVLFVLVEVPNVIINKAKYKSPNLTVMHTK